MINKQIHINSMKGTIGYGKTYGEKSFNGSPIFTSQHVLDSVTSSNEFSDIYHHKARRGKWSPPEKRSLNLRGKWSPPEKRSLNRRGKWSPPEKRSLNRRGKWSSPEKRSLNLRVQRAKAILMPIAKEDTNVKYERCKILFGMASDEELSHVNDKKIYVRIGKKKE